MTEEITELVAYTECAQMPHLMTSSPSRIPRPTSFSPRQLVPQPTPPRNNARADAKTPPPAKSTTTAPITPPSSDEPIARATHIHKSPPRMPVTPPRTHSRLPRRTSLTPKGTSSSSSTHLFTPSPKSPATTATTPSSVYFTGLNTPLPPTPAVLRPPPQFHGHVRASTSKAVVSPTSFMANEQVLMPQGAEGEEKGLRRLRLASTTPEMANSKCPFTKPITPLNTPVSTRRNRLHIPLRVRVSPQISEPSTPQPLDFAKSDGVHTQSPKGAVNETLKEVATAHDTTQPTRQVLPVESFVKSTTTKTSPDPSTKAPQPSDLLPLQRALHSHPLASSGSSSSYASNLKPKASPTPMKQSGITTPRPSAAATFRGYGFTSATEMTRTKSSCASTAALNALAAVKEALRVCEENCGRMS